MISRHFLRGEHLVEARFLDVEDFTLSAAGIARFLAVTPLLRRAARGSPSGAQFGRRRVSVPDSPPVCPADRLNPARLYDGSRARRAASLRAASIILPTERFFASRWVSSGYSLSSSFICCSTADFALGRDQLIFWSVRENFGSVLLRNHRNQTFTGIVAGGADFGLCLAFFVHIGVQRTGHRRTKACGGTAVALRNVVGKAVDVFTETIVPLQRYFHADTVFFGGK